MMRIGVLAVQGAFIEHEHMLRSLGVSCFEIRNREDIAAPFDGLILPGGESTVMGALLRDLELLEPLRAGKDCSYRPYDCKQQKLTEPVAVRQDRLIVVEGSYSCHPTLWERYDLHVFLTVNPQEQLRRIERRNGSQGLEMFRQRWIPLEERYFSACRVEERCELRLSSGE